MAARPSGKIVVAEREGSEPLLGIQGSVPAASRTRAVPSHDSCLNWVSLRGEG
jgi:hypothetical protein